MARGEFRIHLQPHTPGDLYGCETKGVAQKGIRKSMKTKGEQNWVRHGGTERTEEPTAKQGRPFRENRSG